MTAAKPDYADFANLKVFRDACIAYGRAQGVERAAQLVKKIGQDYHEDCGLMEPDTGAWNYPRGGDEHLETLDDVETRIRALLDKDEST
jgi:hypothetical protein